MLIVFEGIDGSGKNTQIRRLLAFLRQHRVKYKLHKYPTRKARGAFAHLSGKKNVPPLELAGIFSEDIMAGQEKLRKEMSAGFVVICDRYLHSTLAYQGVKLGYPRLRKALEGRGAMAADLVVLLDIPAAAGAKRKKRQKTPDRHEKDAEFLEKVRMNYLRMERGGFLSYKYALIDAAGDETGIFSEILSHVEPLIIRKLEKQEQPPAG